MQGAGNDCSNKHVNFGLTVVNQDFKSTSQHVVFSHATRNQSGHGNDKRKLDCKCNDSSVEQLEPRLNLRLNLQYVDPWSHLCTYCKADPRSNLG